MRGPNATYIPRWACGWSVGLALGQGCFTLGLWEFALGHVGFWIPTCWYRQCKSLWLGVLPNVNPQREGFHVAVEYSLYIQG